MRRKTATSHVPHLDGANAAMRDRFRSPQAIVIASGSSFIAIHGSSHIPNVEPEIVNITGVRIRGSITIHWTVDGCAIS